MLDWHLCQVCNPLEIELLLLLSVTCMFEADEKQP